MKSTQEIAIMPIMTLRVEVWQITSREISKNTNLQLKRKSIVLDGYKFETIKCMNTKNENFFNASSMEFLWPYILNTSTRNLNAEMIQQLFYRYY